MRQRQGREGEEEGGEKRSDLTELSRLSSPALVKIRREQFRKCVIEQCAGYGYYIIVIIYHRKGKIQSYSPIVAEHY